MTDEKSQKRSGLVKMLEAVFFGAAVLISIPLGKSAYNVETHNYSEVFSDKIETHEIACKIDSWFKYSKFKDGTEKIEFHRGSLDSLTGWSSFDSLDARVYDGGDKIQEIRMGKIIITRDKDYENFLGSFNYGDVALEAFREIAEHRKSAGEVYRVDQGSRPWLFDLDNK